MALRVLQGFVEKRLVTGFGEEVVVVVREEGISLCQQQQRQQLRLGKWSMLRCVQTFVGKKMVQYRVRRGSEGEREREKRSKREDGFWAAIVAHKAHIESLLFFFVFFYFLFL